MISWGIYSFMCVGVFVVVLVQTIVSWLLPLDAVKSWLQSFKILFGSSLDIAFSQAAIISKRF